MKPSYNGFEAKRSGGYIELPVPGAYIGEIQDVRFIEGKDGQRGRIECKMEITEGEYKGRYNEVFEDQRERFGNATYKGVFRIVCPSDDDETWVVSKFQGNLWCVQESNPGYKWDWDEKKLKGKKVGFSVRKRFYTYDNKDRETTEIGQFETIDDVRNGKCKLMKARDQRKEHDDTAEESTDGSNFTDVSKDVAVPW